VELMMDVKVESEAALPVSEEDAARLAEIQEGLMVEQAMQEQAEAEPRKSVPVLDDVMNADELEQITLEGLAANPEQTPEEQAKSLEMAQQQEAYMNYLKQQHFWQFMAHRPQPASARTCEWGLVKYLLICHEKAEFDHQPEIAALFDGQWYHGIMTGNIAVYRQDDGEVKVALKRPYIGVTTNVQYTDAELAAQKLQQHKAMPRKQRRQAELAK
jgi:hypothetical protein